MAIQHPNIYYFIIDSNWSSTNNLEYWNKGNNVTTNNNNQVYKTIYSPSPTYYAEPRTAAFTGFTTSGGNQTSGFNVSGAFDKGWNFYCLPNFTGNTVFFSASGFRSSQHWDANNSTGGVIADFGVYGSFLSAGPSTSAYARFLFFDPGRIYPQNEYARSDGHLIRPVSE